MTRTAPAAVLLALALAAGAAPASAQGSGDSPASTGAQGSGSSGNGTATGTVTGTTGSTTPGGSTGGTGGNGPRGGGGGGNAPTSGTVYRTIQVGVAPCAPVPGTNYAAVLADQQRVLPDGEWVTTRTYCATEAPPEPGEAPTGPVLDPAVIRQTAVTLRAQVRVPGVEVAVQPPAGALVNQPALFHVAPPPAPPTATTVDALSQLTVTVSLGQPTYTWSFGDGAGRSGLTTTGRPYSRGARVPAEGAGDPYISHTYAGPGTRSVTVTATYPVSFSYGPPATTEQLAPLTASQTVQLPVRTARSELVER